MIFINLKDAYLRVLVHPDSRRFLRFVVDGQVYQFKALCFGRSTAPQVFTRVMVPVSVMLHGHPDTLVSGRLVSPHLVQEGDPVGKGCSFEPLSTAWYHGQWPNLTSTPLAQPRISGCRSLVPF